MCFRDISQWLWGVVRVSDAESDDVRNRVCACACFPSPPFALVQLFLILKFRFLCVQRVRACLSVLLRVSMLRIRCRRPAQTRIPTHAMAALCARAHECVSVCVCVCGLRAVFSVFVFSSFSLPSVSVSVSCTRYSILQFCVSLSTSVADVMPLASPPRRPSRCLRCLCKP